MYNSTSLQIIIDEKKRIRKNTKYIILPTKRYVKPRAVKYKEFVSMFEFRSAKRQTNWYKVIFKRKVFKTFIDLIMKDMIFNEVEYNITRGKLKDVYLKAGTIEKFLGYYNFQEHLKNGNKDSNRYAVRIGFDKGRMREIYGHTKSVQFADGVCRTKNIPYFIPYKGHFGRVYHNILKKHVKETGIRYNNQFAAINNE